MDRDVQSAVKGLCVKGLCVPLLLGLVLLGSTLGLATLSRAQAPAGSEPAEYRPLMKEAVEELRTGHFEEAYQLFMEAHGIWAGAPTARALGMTCFEMGRYVQAGRWFEQALGAGRRALQGDKRVEVEQALKRAKRYVVSLRVQTTPVDAEVRIDGAVVQRDEAGALRLDPGSYQLEVRAEGHERYAVSVKVGAGHPTELEIALVAAPEQPTAPVVSAAPVPTVPAAAVPGAAVPAGVDTGPGPLQLPPAVEPVPVYKRWWLWTGVGVAVVGAGVAGLLLMDRSPGEPEPYGTQGLVVSTRTEGLVMRFSGGRP